MVKCPKCDQDIDSLIAYETRTIESIVEVTPDENRLTYSDQKNTSTETEWCCPECYEPLGLGDETQAKEFLKGELELEAIGTERER